MPRSSSASAPAVAGVGDLLKTLRDPGRNLVDKYRGRPLELADKFGVKLPEKPLVVMQKLGIYDEERHGPITPGIRDLVLDVCMKEVLKAVAVANRGGGKSYSVSFIEFYLWMIEDFECINIGGSELQADNVYRYLLAYMDDDEFWKTLIKGGIDGVQREKTFKTTGAWVRVLAASQKSVRSPHAGGERKVKNKTIKRGGFLAIDEEAETDRDIVETSFGMVNTAMPSVIVRASTFHNVGGTFQEVIDHAAEMGYRIYRWDIFDVCSGCDCTEPGVCESEEACFREDHWEDFIDPEDGELKRRLIHRAYCGGRAKYATGWVPYSEIVSMWMNYRRNHARFEVEAMGLRPSSKGYVIRDLTSFADSIVDASAASLYQPGAPVTVCVDWGTAAGGITVWQEQFGGNHVLLECDLLIDNNQTQIVGKVLEYATKYRKELVEIAADSGGGGNYLNPDLETVHRQRVRPVVFNSEKESAVAAWNAFNEAGKLVIPKEHAEFVEQVQNWKRVAGRIGKVNDHLCDSAICYFSKFVDQLGIVKIPVPPLSFSTAMSTKTSVTPGPATPGGRAGGKGAFSKMPVAVSIRRPKSRR